MKLKNVTHGEMVAVHLFVRYQTSDLGHKGFKGFVEVGLPGPGPGPEGWPQLHFYLPGDLQVLPVSRDES